MKTLHTARRGRQGCKRTDAYSMDPDPATMSDKNLIRHFCEPWFGCERCDYVCVFGREYLHRLETGKITEFKPFTAE